MNTEELDNLGSGEVSAEFFGEGIKALERKIGIWE